MIKKFSLLILLFSASIVKADDNDQSVQVLLRKCEEVYGNPPSNYYDPAFCLGAVEAASLILLFNCRSADAGYNPSLKLRMGSMPSNGAGAQAFINWARQNPQRWGDLGMSGLITALSTTFPCESRG